MMRRLECALALIPVLAVAAAAQVTAPHAEEVGAYARVLEYAYPADEPGAAALVARDGDVLYRGAAGLADLELGVPLEPGMVFEIGSITKQFTAAAIMMLAEEGKLGLDDPLTKFLPDYPAAVGERVTVEHLLTHTSGIVSYTGIPGYMAEEIRKDLTVRELVDVFKDLPPEFEPGERYAYNNSGYVLLGAIIEEASGMSYADFIRRRIFEPLGMRRSYYGSLLEIIPGRASGYGGSGGEYMNAPYLSMTQPYSAGALMMNVDDFYTWTRALFGGEVVSEASLERMITPYTLENGESTDYGYGLGSREIRGRRVIAHGGGIFGYVTYGLYVPEEDVFVAVFSNNTGSEAGLDMIAIKLAAIALGDPYPEWEEIALDEQTLERYVGVYEIGPEARRLVTVEDGKLHTQRTGGSKLRAFPSSETHFFYKHSLSHFEFVVEDGEVTAMRMYQGGASEAELARKVSDEVPTREEVDVDPAIYDRYVGVYELRPGFDLTVTREGDRLMVQATGQPRLVLHPESETDYFLQEVDAQIVFVVEPDGEVNELVLHQGGRGTRARRKE